MTQEVTDLFIFDSGTRLQSSERVSPHKLSIMALVCEYMHATHSLDQTSDTGGTTGSQLSDRDRRVFMVTLLSLLQGPDMDLRSLRSHLEPSLNPVLTNSLYQLLKEIAMVGVKPINDFFENNSKLFSTAEEGCIKRESIMGLYMRRMELAYNEMSFAQLVETHIKIRRYYEAGFPDHIDETDSDEGGLKRGNSVNTGNPLSVSEQALHLSQLNERSVLESLTGQNLFSRKQAEYFIANQALLLTHNELSGLPPDRLQQKISQILCGNPDMAEAHFLSYMNSLRLGEYCTALHSLYHYFDRKACPSTDSGNLGKKKGDGVAVRYAALNLASLQFRFGNKEESKAVLKDVVNMSQETGDHVCLQHALVWLSLLEEGGGPVLQAERSIEKTIDLSLPHLTVLGINSLSRQLGLRGAETPAKVIHYFTQSNLINCMQSNYSMMSMGLSQRAAMWAFYGHRELSSLDSQIVLHLDTSVNSVYYSGQSVCIAMCNLAQQHADTGQYAAANEILHAARLRFPVNTEHASLWQSCQQRIQFTRAVLGGRLTEAQQILTNLEAVDPPEADIRRGILHTEKGQVTQAFHCFHQLLKSCEDSVAGDYLADYRCRVLLELSQLYLATGQPTAAVPHLSDCVSHSRVHHLVQHEALASVHMAMVQLLLGLASAALPLVESQLLPLLTHAPSLTKARVLYVYARCKVGAADTLTTESEKKSEQVSALDLLSTASSLFHSCEAHRQEKDVLYYQAMLHHAMGDRQGRNRSAHGFNVLDKLYPTLTPLRVNIV